MGYSSDEDREREREREKRERRDRKFDDHIEVEVPTVLEQKGWLSKQSPAFHKKWQRRWCEIRDSRGLLYFKDPKVMLAIVRCKTLLHEEGTIWTLTKNMCCGFHACRTLSLVVLSSLTSRTRY